MNYHFGLFRQKFVHNLQQEEPDPWIETPSWLKKTDVTYQIPYRGFTLTSRMYDVQVTGYHNRTNSLHLFDVETIREDLVKEGISFDKTDIRENLTLFLYPDDSDRAGRILRIYQQYFMCANAARLILDEAMSRGSSLHDLAEYAVIQINDTHPSMIIPELIRLLTAEHGFEMDEAIQVVSSICAYTNHTILAEALETWPMDFFKEAVPQLIPIMEILDDKVRRKFDDPSVYLIDRDDTGSHGPHGHPLRIFRQRSGCSPHRDPEGRHPPQLLSAVPGEIQQQDQRHHLPPLAPLQQSGAVGFYLPLIGEEWKKDASHAAEAGPAGITAKTPKRSPGFWPSRT